MLIKFLVENHLSLFRPQELSLVAAKLTDNASGLLKSPALPKYDLVPAAIIYGANASGKSNVIDSLETMQGYVLHSHTQGKPGEGVNRRPFTLNEKAQKRPSLWVLDFIVNKVRYQYGFQATAKAFTKEWLFFYPKGKKTALFDRTGSQTISFNRMLKGQNKLISELMRPNSLFLSTATQNNHEQLSPIRDAIASIQFVDVISPGFGTIIAQHGEKEIDPRIIDFLKRIGTGVVSSRRKARDVSKETLVMQSELTALFRRHFEFAKDIKFPDTNIEIQLGHLSADKKEVFFDLYAESAGTRRLLLLLAAIFQALDKGTAIIIDEFDASLHTQIGELILALFSDPKTNPLGAQLIATTHDTNLMNSRHLRRDQIWLTEKDQEGQTHLFPLTDIRTRNTDNIEKGYLQGRYGAIPYSGSIERLTSRD